MNLTDKLSSKELAKVKNRMEVRRKNAKQGLKVGMLFGEWKVVSTDVDIRLVSLTGNKGNPKLSTFVLVNDSRVEKWVEYSSLKNGRSTKSRSSDWGIKNVKEFKTRWRAIMERCYNPNCKAYPWYGAKGIQLSSEFQDMFKFCKYLSTLGGFKKGLHIDRIDGSKNYERGNLRWATARENALNKKNILKVNRQGEELTFKSFVKKYCRISLSRARDLLKDGYELSEIESYVGRNNHRTKPNQQNT
jgi:hypothetical protein